MISTYSIMTNIMKGVIYLNNSNQRPEASPNKLMELMMLNIFQKHGVTTESVQGNLSEEQKKLILDLLEELKQQTDALVGKTTFQKPQSK
jgi:spore coat protein W